MSERALGGGRGVSGGGGWVRGWGRGKGEKAKRKWGKRKGLEAKGRVGGMGRTYRAFHHISLRDILTGKERGIVSFLHW